MPQKTVTLEDQVYWDLTQNLEKGRQSAFVNEAIKDAVRMCGFDHWAMHWYACEGLERAREYLKEQNERAMAELEFQRALNHPNQENLTNIEWMKKQKEAEE